MRREAEDELAKQSVSSVESPETPHSPTYTSGGRCRMAQATAPIRDFYEAALLDADPRSRLGAD